MPKKRVLLIESGRLLGGVIGSLFLHHEQISLIEASPSSAAELIQIIEKNKVQIIVLDDTLHKEYLSRLLRYMRTTDGLRVVVVEADTNRVEVYQKQQAPIQRSADFFAVL